jgi:hypothetical protein
VFPISLLSIYRPISTCAVCAISPIAL